MRILFVHQNFPGQYARLLACLARDPANQIVFVTKNANRPLPGITKIVYELSREAGRETHFYLRSFEQAVLHGQAVARVALGLKKQGFVPDVMLGHNAWGETLYLKDVFPQAPLLAYFEFFYRVSGGDVGFDPEFPADTDSRLRVRTRNAVNLLGLDAADCGQTATEWQHSTYPERYHDLIVPMHEGIDTRRVKPDAGAALALPDGRMLTRADEVVTYVARNLEPYRGFHTFMRALPDMQRRRPRAHVVIVGGDEVSYGSRPRDGRTWRQVLLAEVGDQLDLSRVHFLGQVPYAVYLQVLQVSSVHVYLTYPFVLSWSMLEAMAAGCVVVGSATPPVEEVITDGWNGLLVDFFDNGEMAEKIDAVLSDPDRRETLRVNARQTMVTQYDCATVCMPQQLRLMHGLIGNNAGKATEIMPGVLAATPHPSFTAKELEVLGWLREGKSVWEVAQILARSEHTVKNQIRNIYGKLGVKNRVEALRRTAGLTLADSTVRIACK